MSYTFDQYKIDTICLGQSRLLSSVKKSTTTIIPYLDALTEQTQDWNTITCGVFSGRYLPNANGIQLDIIGRLIGQERPNVDGDEILYFTYDVQPPQNIGYDGDGVWWMQNAPTNSTGLADDTVYRQYIEGKIFKNQVTGASDPELLEFAKRTLGLNISVQLAVDEPCAINIYTPAGTPLSYKKLLVSKTTTNQVENNYFLPVATCTRIKKLIPLDNLPVFYYDKAETAFNAGYDVGNYTLGIPADNL